MRDRIKSIALLLSLSLLALTTFAQTTTVTGTVNNKSSKESLGAVSVTVKGGTSGTFTDDKGRFKLITDQKPPFTLVISSVGFADQEVQVTGTQTIAVNLEPYYALGNDIVVAASRVPERILESPVSIERINNTQIVTAPTNSYYDILRTIPGVDITTSSLTFETPSTRGFNGSGNVRLNQIVDGMDNQAPGLNFSVGSTIGLTDLDVDNMELLEGASSALYGPGGMNGTLIINSKDPYKYQGLSAEVKEGVMNLGNSARSASVYNDYTVRWAQKIGDKFAFKLSGEYIEGNDWLANDSSDYSINANNPHGGIVAGTRASDPNYNGVNVYGDETSQNLSSINNSILSEIESTLGTANYEALYQASQQYFQAYPKSTLTQYNQFLTSIGGGALTQPVPGLPVAPSTFLLGNFENYYTNNNVSRTGYKEQDVVSPITKDIKVSAGLYYKFTDQMTLSLTGNYGTGNTVYTGADRYVLNDLQMGQYKVELKSKNWFIRGYTTQENSGNAYNATVNTQLLNEAWGGGSPVWYPTYMAAYTQFLNAGESTTQAANAARAYADEGRPAPGSALYNHLADSIAKIPIPAGGHFLDRTDLYVGEAQYNLTQALGLKTKGTDVLVGGDYKQYELNSQGTLFADTAGKIGISEVGVYGQVSQKFFHDVLKLSVSGRYDKNQNFDGKFTPRATAVITIAKNQNIRLSYQEAYRFPTTQNQWINLNTGEGYLIGGLPQLRDFYGLNASDGVNYNPGYTETSVAAGNPQVATYGKFTPETANSFEAGYKGLVANSKLLIDIYGYYTQYTNLLTRETVLQLPEAQDPNAAADFADGNYKAFSISVNYSGKINTYGYGASLQYLLRHNFYLTANASSDNISNASQVYSPTSPFVSYFNTPKYRSNVGIGNSGFGYQKRLGFNLIWHWQDKFYEQADFINGYVNAYSSLDADISYKVTGIKSVIKLGATNLLNHYYLTAPGNPYIGGMYFISFAYNVL